MCEDRIFVGMRLCGVKSKRMFGNTYKRVMSDNYNIMIRVSVDGRQISESTLSSLRLMRKICSYKSKFDYDRIFADNLLEIINN